HRTTAGDAASLCCTLSRRCLALLDEAIAEQRRRPQPITSAIISPALRDAGSTDLRPALDKLEGSPGFVILDGVDSGRYSDEEMKLVYWLVGQVLGKPHEQNVQGTLLYDVRDTGEDVRYGARFSVTNAESTFHTDNSFGADITDYVGLL